MLDDKLIEIANPGFDPSEEQLAIMRCADTLNSSMDIVATAGAGKTTILKMVTSIFDHHNLDVMFTAFNRAIADDMKSGLYKKGLPLAKGPGQEGVYVTTSHAAGLRLLTNKFDFRFDPHKAKVKYWGLIDDARINGLGYEKLMHYDDNKRAIRYYLGKLVDIVRLTNTPLNPEDVARLMMDRRPSFEDLIDDNDPSYMRRWSEFATLVVKQGIDLFRKDQAMDFTDMIYLPTVFQDEVRPAKRDRYEAVLCDETQDFNECQYNVNNLFLREDYLRVIVYDPAQSINWWAGATNSIAERIAKEDNAEHFTIGTSFRCPHIIADRVHSHVPYFQVPDTAKPGEIEPIGMTQALAILRKAPWTLVISRSTRHLIAVALELIGMNIPVSLRGENLASIFKGHLSDIQEFAAKNSLSLASSQFPALVEHYSQSRVKIMTRKKIGEDSILEFESEIGILLKLWDRRQNNTIDAFHSQLDSLQEQAQSKDGVQLMTIHTAKGLEANWVIILCSRKEYDALTKNEFPYGSATGMVEISQEYNTWYVALTRTKDKVFLVNAEEGAAAVTDFDPRIAQLQKNPFSDNMSVDWNDMPERIRSGILEHYALLRQHVSSEASEAYWRSQEPRFLLQYPGVEFVKPVEVESNE